MDRSVHATVPPPIGSAIPGIPAIATGIRRGAKACAPKTCAPRAQRVDNSARDSVPDTGRTLPGHILPGRPRR